MEPPSTPGRTPRQGVSQGNPSSTTSAASPFASGDPDSPKLRASTLAYGPRIRTVQPIPSPPTPKAPSAPRAAPVTPQPQQQPMQAAFSNSSTHLPGTPGPITGNWPPAAGSGVPRTPVRAASRGHQRVPSTTRSGHQRTPSLNQNIHSSGGTPVQVHSQVHTHTRTPSSASYNRQRAVAEQIPGTSTSAGSAGPHTPMAPGQATPTNTATPTSSAQTTSRSVSSSGGPKKPQKRTSIGPWDFVKSIGAGSMGQVKLAVNRYTKQTAAIKIVPKAFTHKSRDGRETNEARDARVIREAAIGRLLDHPNISKLYDVYSMTGHFYLVFEYISGGQMLDYIISHGCVKENQARRFARSISSALEYCHNNSVVHRDLKIENILIADDGDIRLIDFGLSNLFRRDDLLRTFCGSLYFAAPELLNAMPYVGPEIDVWSFGVVLYVLVSGKVPFEDKSMTVLHSKIKRGTIDYPQWLSSLCVDLLSRMLTVNPSERATLDEVMHHPWMIKGYSAPPETYVPRRLPLTLDSLDPLVIDEMEALGIGDACNIERALKTILGSAEYQASLDNWYDRQEEDLANNGSIASSHAGSQFRVGLNSKIPDPLNSFAPEISCYLLTRERLAKSKMVTITSDETILEQALPLSQDKPLHSQKYSNAVLQQPLPMTPVNPRKSPQKATISSPEPNVKNGRARAKTLGSAYDMIQPALVLSTPKQNDPADSENLPPKAYVSNIPQQAQVGLVTPMTAVKPIDLNMEQPSPSLPRSRIQGRIVSQPTPQSHLQQQQNQQQQVHQQQQQQPSLSLFRKLSLRRKPTGHSRAKSTGYTNDLIEPKKDTSLSSQQSLSSMPSIESPKPVFFRGIFSVQSTSTKPLQEIRAEIIRVLNLKQIEYVEIRGGFACVARRHHHSQHHNYYQPSQQNQRLQRSSSSSLTMYGANHSGNNSNGSGGVGDTTTPSRSAYGDYLVPPSPQTPPSTPRHRRMISENGIISPAISANGSTESIDVEIGASDMLGESQQKSSIPVRFEIDIVRVPIVSLHGIQFKKMTGNVWQYKNLAQEILEALRI